MGVLTAAQFVTKIAALFADNTAGDITEADVREVFTDFKDSFAYQADVIDQTDIDASIEAFRTAAKVLTNKSITPRVSEIVTINNLDVNSDLIDGMVVRGLNQPMTINNPTGAPVDFQRLSYRFKDDGVSRALTWGVGLVQLGSTPPANTTAGKWMLIEFQWNQRAGKWQCIQVNIEA